MQDLNKPKSLSVRNYLQRKLSVKLMLSEDVIDEILTESGRQIKEAMDNNQSVEASGFGKFLFRKNKALKDIEKFQKMLKTYYEELDKANTEKEKTRLQKRINSAKDILEYLNKKTNE